MLRPSGLLGDKHVNPNPPHENWNDILLFVPLVALLIFGYFRVDEIFGSKRYTGHTRPSHPPEHPAESNWRADPDGRPWN